MIFNDEGNKVSVDWSEGAQPVAERPFWKAYTYDRKDSKEFERRSLALEVPITHLAEHYRTHPDVAKYVGRNTWKKVWVADGVELHSFDDYRHWMIGYAYPQEIRLSAERAAGRLARSLEFRTRKQVSQDRLTGRIDRHKIQRIERDVARGQYVHEQVRPYYRVDKVDSDLPTVAVIGAMHTTAMSDAYCSSMIQMILTLRWACEIAGLPVVSAATQGAVFKEQIYYHPWRYGLSKYTKARFGECDDVTQVFLLSTPEYQPPFKVYSTFMYENLWMHLKVHLKGVHPAYADIIAGMEDSNYRLYKTKNTFGLYDCFATNNGGFGVSWARNVAKADIVIACGEMFDGQDADLYLPYMTDPDKAIAMLEKVLGE